MKKIIFPLLLWAAALLPAQTLDESELKRQVLESVEFTNYQGPHAYLNTREEILNIGRSLGSGVATSNRFTLGDKYGVIRVYEPENPGVSADILSLLPAAGVDHIRNLNLIIAGYLEVVFRYSLPDALLLADFITRYNAFYRGQVEYASGVYVPGVLKEVTPENLGLSLVFSEWPGKSQILIPLLSTVSKGERGSVSADVISGPEVTVPLQQEPGGLEQRKELINLKEQEIVQEQQAIAQKEEDLNIRLEMTADPGMKAVPAAGPGETPAPGTPEATGVVPDAAATEAESLQQEKQVLETKKQELALREQTLQQDRQEVAAAENKKLTEDPASSASAAAVPAAVTPAPAAAVLKPVPEPQVFFTVTDNEGLFGQLAVLDMKSGKILNRSSLNTIRNRKFETLGTSYLVIAGRSEGSGTVHLFTLNQTNFTVILEGKTEVSPFSPLVVNGNQFYAVVKSSTAANPGDADWKLALFDEKLTIIATSTESVVPGTTLIVRGSQVLLQGRNGSILQLNSKTLVKEGDFRG